jgi:DNA-binding transcriptional MerR regulator
MEDGMRIGQLAERTGVSAKTLRFYEEQGILPEPPRTSSGYRDYAPEVVDRVAFVRQAQTAGLTLAQIRQVLAVRDGGQAPCRHVTGFVDERLAHIDQRLAELAATRRHLLALRRRVRRLEPSDCAPDEICTAMAVGHPDA